MTLVEYLQSAREKSQEQVDQIEHQHDVERGLYVPHSEIVHHVYMEARH